MDVLHTPLRLSALGLMACLQTAPARAADVGDDPARFFATCAGRLSALMEHQRLFDGAASEQTGAYRDDVLSLLDAVTLPGQDRPALHQRVAAKAAQAALLTQARFGGDRTLARIAQRRADVLTRTCLSLLGQS